MAAPNIGNGLAAPATSQTTIKRLSHGKIFNRGAPDESEQSCAKAAMAFIESGSHFMTHADHGCEHNEHKAWMIVELDSKEMARSLLPPVYRARAKIVKFNNYASGDFQKVMEDHGES